MPAVSDLEVASNEDSQAGDKSVSTAGGFPFTEEAKQIPYRIQQVLLNWIFIVASTALILNFGALQEIFVDPTSRFAELCHWFCVLSCIGWLLGFILLTHWLHSVGATRMGLAGGYLKIVASCFFNLMPMTGTMNDPLLGGAAGLWWSGLAGILFFHVGNLVNCLDFYLHTPPGADKRKGWLYHGNLPVTSMWVCQVATWNLLVSSFLSCTFNGASWAPLVATPEPPVYICQFAGSSLLLLGAIVCVVWCDGFRNFSH